jgi:hypothetical protein
MAGFNLRALSLLAQSNYTPGGSANVSWLTYGTTDALATVLAAGYFNTARDKGKIKTNDIVLGEAVSGGVGVPFSIVFTSVPASGNVLASLVDLASGLAVGAGHGLQVLPFFFNQAEIAANGDLLTNYVPGFNFRLEKFDWRQLKPVTTAAKLATLNSQDQRRRRDRRRYRAHLGAVHAGWRCRRRFGDHGLNVGGPTDSLSIVASGVTAFAKAPAGVLISLRNLDG